MHTATSTNPARGPIRAERETNRRKMKATRPAIELETKFRIRQWYQAIEQARDDRKISLGCDRYLKRIKGQRTVAHGGFADVRDVVMGGWLKRSRAMVMRYRAEAVKAGLLEDKGTRGRDNKPCMVRPILADQSPVFNNNSATPSVAKVVHEPTELKPTEITPPNPPTPQDNEPKTIGQALVAPDVVSGNPPSTPPKRRAKRLGNDEVAAAPEPITFKQVWVATDMVGVESAAAVAWRKLSHDDKVAIAAAIKRDGRLRTGKCIVFNWLENRLWPTLPVPQTAEEVAKQLAEKKLIRIRAETHEGYAWLAWWKKYENPLGLVVGKDGYFVRRFPTRWPPEQ